MSEYRNVSLEKLPKNTANKWLWNCPKCKVPRAVYVSKDGSTVKCKRCGSSAFVTRDQVTDRFKEV